MGLMMLSLYCMLRSWGTKFKIKIFDFSYMNGPKIDIGKVSHNHLSVVYYNFFVPFSEAVIIRQTVGKKTTKRDKKFQY